MVRKETLERWVRGVKVGQLVRLTDDALKRFQPGERDRMSAARGFVLEVAPLDNVKVMWIAAIHNYPAIFTPVRDLRRAQPDRSERGTDLDARAAER